MNKKIRKKRLANSSLRSNSRHHYGWSKEAALLEPPPLILEAAKSFIVTEWCSEVLDAIEKEREPGYLSKYLIAQLDDLSLEVASLIDSYKRNYDGFYVHNKSARVGSCGIDLTGWKLWERRIPDPDKRAILEKRLRDKRRTYRIKFMIRPHIVRSGFEHIAAGSWDPSRWIIAFYQDWMKTIIQPIFKYIRTPKGNKLFTGIDKNAFYDGIMNCEQTATHEMRHCSQFILKGLLELSHFAGHPGLTDPFVADAVGIPLNKVPTKDSDFIPYELRDIEFETILGDEVGRFIHQWNATQRKAEEMGIPEAIWGLDLLYIFIGKEKPSLMEIKINKPYLNGVRSKSEWFSYLKENDPKRYRAAASKFIAELDRLGYMERVGRQASLSPFVQDKYEEKEEMQNLEKLSILLRGRGFKREAKLVKMLGKISSKNELSPHQNLSFHTHDDAEREMESQGDKLILILSNVLARRIEVPDNKMQTWLGLMKPKLKAELVWLIGELYKDFVFYYDSIFTVPFASEWEVGKGALKRTIKAPKPEENRFLGSITPENNPVSSEDEKEALEEASLRTAVMIAMKITQFGFLELKDSLTLKDISIDIYDKFGKTIITQMLRVVEDFEAIGENYKRTVVEGDTPDDFIDIGFFEEDEDEYWGDH